MSIHDHPPTKHRQLITQREAANRLSISERTFRALVAMGEIRVIKVSPRRVAVDPADVDAYIDQRRS